MKPLICCLVAFCVVVSGCYGRAPQPNAGVQQQPNQQLLSQLMEDLRQGYDRQFGMLQSQFNKRYLALEAKYIELKEELQQKRRGARQTEISKVAFYAQLTHDQTGVGNYQAIVFDLVTTNHGNGYNKSDGIFTATIAGTYVFSWTAANGDNSHMQTELVVNNQVMGRTWSDSGNHADFSIASNTVVVDLNQGDVVWIRSNTAHSHIISGHYQLSTFSGWLLAY